MSGQSDLTRLIERMEQATEDARTATREAHAATKDLRHAIKEAQRILDGEVGDRMDRQIAAGLNEYKDELVVAIEEATAGIYRRFDTIAAILLDGDTKDNRTLETMIRQMQGESTT